MQARNTLFSVGTLVSPLITDWFLVPLPSRQLLNLDLDNDLVVSSHNVSGINTTSEAAKIKNQTQNNCTSELDVIQGLDVVRWAYTPGAVAYLLTAVIFAVVCVLQSNTLRLKRLPSKRSFSTNNDEVKLNSHHNETDHSCAVDGASKTVSITMTALSAAGSPVGQTVAKAGSGTESGSTPATRLESKQDVESKVTLTTKCQRATFLTLLGAVFGFHTWTMYVIMQLLSLLAQQGLGWQTSTANRLVAVCSGALLAGRIVSIPVSAFLPPVYFICANVALQALGLALVQLRFAGLGTDAALWAGAAITGLGISSFISSLLVWSTCHVPVGSTLSTACMLGCYMGSTVGTALTTMTLTSLGHMAIVHWATLAAVLQCVMLALAVGVVRVAARCNKTKINALAQAGTSQPYSQLNTNTTGLSACTKIESC